MTTILAIDDEDSILRVVEAYLVVEGYTVHLAQDGSTGLAAFRRHEPDLIILDVIPNSGKDIPHPQPFPAREAGLQKGVCSPHRSRGSRGWGWGQMMLPGLNGLDVLQQIRRELEEVDRVVGLTVGADDYLTKPEDCPS